MKKILSILNNFFEIDKRGSTIKTELYAGLTTFLSMAYILVVNPNNILQLGTSDPRFSSVFIATAIGSFLGTIIMAIIANIDFEKKKLLGIPMVTTRGYILVNENEHLIKQIEKNADRIISTKLKEKNVTYNDIKNEIINGLMPSLLKSTGRVPIILPIIMDIKNYTK